MPLLRTLFFALLLIISMNVQSSERSGEIPPEVTAYEVLELMKTHVITREQVDWPALTSTLDNFDRPFTAESLRQALMLILEQANTGHTFYKSDVPPKFVMQRKAECVATNIHELPDIPSTIGYLRVDSFNEPSQEAKLSYVRTLRDEITRQQEHDLNGWIIDLRHNAGGNMWPMLAAVAPLLDNGIHGYFVKPDGSRTGWGTYNGQSFLNNQFMIGINEPRTATSILPVAVLSSERTASSGESILVAFEGKSYSRSFGKPSCGMSTANHPFQLSNGASLQITTSTMASQNGVLFGGPIPVDHASDHPVKDAIKWLSAFGD